MLKSKNPQVSWKLCCVSWLVLCWLVWSGGGVVVFMVVLLDHLHHPRWCRAWPAWLRPDWWPHCHITPLGSVLSEGSDQQHETSRHRQQAGNMEPQVKLRTPQEKITAVGLVPGKYFTLIFTSFVIVFYLKFILQKIDYIS